MSNELNELKKQALEARRKHNEQMREQEHRAKEASADYFASCVDPLSKLLSELRPQVSADSRRLAIQYTQFLRDDWNTLLEIRALATSTQAKLEDFDLPVLYINSLKRVVTCDSNTIPNENGWFTWSVGRRLRLCKRRSIKWVGTFEAYEVQFDGIEDLDDPQIEFNPSVCTEYRELDAHQNKELRLQEAAAEIALASTKLLQWLECGQLSQMIADELKRRIEYLERPIAPLRRPAAMVTRIKPSNP